MKRKIIAAHLKAFQLRFFSQKETGAKVLSWKQHIDFQLVYFATSISCVKFEEHRLNISRVFLDSVIYILVELLMTSYSKKRNVIL